MFIYLFLPGVLYLIYCLTAILPPLYVGGCVFSFMFCNFLLRRYVFPVYCVKMKKIGHHPFCSWRLEVSTQTSMEFKTIGYIFFKVEIIASSFTTSNCNYETLFC